MGDFLGQAVAARRLIVIALALWGVPWSALAQSADSVAVVINDDSPDSRRVGEHYVKARAIPETNVVRIHVPATDNIKRIAFATLIEAPIRAALSRHRLQDRVLYIVLTKGVPLRIEGTEGLDGTIASVDSELTLLYRRMIGRTVPTRGRIPNPYYLANTLVSGAQPFSHRVFDIYLVTRLDAFTADEAMALVDRAQAPAARGRIVLDQRSGSLNNPAGDVWMQSASRRLADLGFADRVLLDRSRSPVDKLDNVLGYYSWGSNDPRNRVRQQEIGFAAGSIAATFAGADARTFEEPPSEWVPTGNWQDHSSFFAGSPQSLIGDLIRQGATGVAGHVADPYLQSTVRPEILFPAYLKGFNLVEAFYMAIPHLSWQTLVIGDPLCRPFPASVSLSRTDIEGTFDDATELPGWFSKRRLEALRSELKDAPANVLTLTLAAESRVAHGDRAGARGALEEATKLMPTALGPQLQLSLLYELDQDFALAQERYEQILKLQPQNVIALNNLAYAIAVHRKTPSEARPMALKAATLAPGNPNVIDTLAWIEHLLGNQAAAAKLITAAAKASPDHADIRLHAAFIYGAGPQLDDARKELDAACELDPELLKREDVQELMQKLSKPKSSSVEPDVWSLM